METLKRENMGKFKYVEIVKDDSQEVVCRMDVTNKSERSIEMIENGASRNLNHNEYTIVFNESDIELPKIEL